jgi:hypothetical protein
LHPASRYLRAKTSKIGWLLSDLADENAAVRVGSDFAAPGPGTVLLEVGPRLNVCTPFSTNAVSICAAVGLDTVTRIEPSRRFSITLSGSVDGAAPPSVDTFAAAIHDRMTECVYRSAITSFALEKAKERWSEVDVLGKGSDALREASTELGLAFDEADVAYVSPSVCCWAVPTFRMLPYFVALVDSIWRIVQQPNCRSVLRQCQRRLTCEFIHHACLALAACAVGRYYTTLFRDQIKRNPTTVECFDLSQSNSEHSRHWFFTGKPRQRQKQKTKTKQKRHNEFSGCGVWAPVASCV